MPSNRGENSEAERTLVSWKEIAVHLNRAERTVKRWEKERGLPVHRVPGGDRGSVFAYPVELADWLKGKGNELDADELPDKPAAGDALIEPANGSAINGRVTAPGGTPFKASPVNPPARHRRAVSLTRVAAWLAPLAVTAIIIFYLWGSHAGSRVTAVGDHEPGAPDLASNSVAVLPFVNAGGDVSSDYLSDGMTESLIFNLARVPQLRVRSRDSVFRLKGAAIGVQEAGSKLGVSKVVSGRVTVEGSNIEFSAELIDVHGDTEIWGKQYAGKTTDLLQLQEKMAGDIAEQLSSTLSAADLQQVTRQGTQNVEAYNLYLKGRYAWNVRDRAKLEAAISDFNQAIEKDPSYALAYSGLADAYSVLPSFWGNPNEDFAKSNAAARKALELDPTLAHPHAVLGAYEIEHDWDFAGGEIEFKKAIALDPSDATAHQWYAEKIGELGRHQEALREINLARELDPLSPVIVRVIGGTFVDAGEFDKGIEVCQHLVQEDPTFPIAHDCLVYAYWGKRMFPEVIEEWKTEARLTGDPDDIKLTDALEHGFRSAGWNGALAGAIAVLEARRERGYASPFQIARFYADMGDKEKAFDWLGTAYRERDGLLLGLNVSPGLDNIRSDPRFAALVRKVGLPQLQ
jgi:TolB-like protein/Tfp pilus assembly protein PilF